MPSLDICFCANKKCILRDKCLRNPDRLPMNEYITMSEFENDGEYCKYFYEK